jgi:hypothetical protein
LRGVRNGRSRSLIEAPDRTAARRSFYLDLADFVAAQESAAGPIVLQKSPTSGRSVNNGQD